MLQAPDPAVVKADVARALEEDVGSGDLTARLLPGGTRLSTRVISREAARLAGRPWVDETFRQLGSGARLRWRVSDGDTLAPGQTVCELDGDAATLLTGERTALNFLQTLSGTATVTARYVDAVRGTGARILDTRKTLPGLRMAQKYAVRCGGGHNHRAGLYDAILIKENHIAAAGSITAALDRVVQREGVLVEVEVENLEQLAEAHAAGVRRALLDNFELSDLEAAVARFGDAMELEASGNVTLERIRQVALTGVDFISVGALTKHLRAVDFSMRFLPGADPVA